MASRTKIISEIRYGLIIHSRFKEPKGPPIQATVAKGVEGVEIFLNIQG